MHDPHDITVSGEVIDPDVEITMIQLCTRCAVETELVERLVSEGVLEPARVTETGLLFLNGSVPRVRMAVRLRSDLGVNMAGAALALDLLDRIERLSRELRRR